LAANEVVIKVRGDTRGAEDAADRLQGRFQKLGDSMKSVGRTMSTRVTLPILALGAVALKVGGDFEQGMNQVRAVSGATGDQFEALREQAKELGRTTQFSASQAAEGMSFLAMAGFEANEILGAMPATLQLAAAGQLELGEAADIASNILTGYRMTTEELTHANDVLVKTFTSTNTNLQQLGEAFKFVAPVASAAGMQFEEASAAIGLMGNAGLQASLAGTALKGAISRLLSPTSEAAEIMERLGINALDSSGDLLPLVNIVGQLEDSGAKTADMLEIFGLRAGPGMSALVSQGSEALRELTEELENSGGTAERIGKVQMEGFNGAMRRMKSALEGAAIAVSESGLLEMFESLINVLAKGAQAFSELPGPVKTAIVAIAGLAAAIGPLLIAMGLLVTIGPNVGIALTLAMGPVGLIIVAIAGLVAGIALLIIHFQTIKRVVQENVEKFAALAISIGMIIPPIGILIATLTLLTIGWEKTQQIIAEVWNKIIAATEIGVNQMIELLNGLIRGWNKLGRLIGQEVDEIATVEIPRWIVAMESVGKGGDELAEKVSTQTDDYYSNMKGMAEATEVAAERINKATTEMAGYLDEDYQRIADGADDISRAWVRAEEVAVASAEQIQAAHDRVMARHVREAAQHVRLAETADAAEKQKQESRTATVGLYDALFDRLLHLQKEDELVVVAAEKNKQAELTNTLRLYDKTFKTLDDHRKSAAEAVARLPRTMAGAGVEAGGSAANRAMAMSALSGGPVLDVRGNPFFDEDRTARDFWDLGPAGQPPPMLGGMTFREGSGSNGQGVTVININADTIIGQSEVEEIVVTALETANNQALPWLPL